MLDIVYRPVGLSGRSTHTSPDFQLHGSRQGIYTRLAGGYTQGWLEDEIAPHMQRDVGTSRITLSILRFVPPLRPLLRDASYAFPLARVHWPSGFSHRGRRYFLVAGYLEDLRPCGSRRGRDW